MCVSWGSQVSGHHDQGWQILRFTDLCSSVAPPILQRWWDTLQHQHLSHNAWEHCTYEGPLHQWHLYPVRSRIAKKSGYDATVGELWSWPIPLPMKHQELCQWINRKNIYSDKYQNLFSSNRANITRDCGSLHRLKGASTPMVGVITEGIPHIFCSLYHTWLNYQRTSTLARPVEAMGSSEFLRL